MSRITLILSSDSPHRTGLPPPLATLDSLPEVVEVYRVVPFLPPGNIGRPTHAPPGSIPPDRFFEFPPVEARWTVYVHFITVSGDVYHDASTSSTNDDGGLHSLNSDAFSFNDDHMTDHFLEDEDDDIIQVKAEQKKFIKHQN